MSQMNQPSKPAHNAAGKHSNDKAKPVDAGSGGKPKEPLLKPKAQTLPMKK